MSGKKEEQRVGKSDVASLAAAVVADVMKPRAKKRKPGKGVPRLSLSSTLMNLALGGHTKGPTLQGKYLYIVGDSSSGKTMYTLSLLAEAARNPAFAKYRFIFDDVEHGALMDVAEHFGKQVARRLEPPQRDKKGKRRDSETIEDFYFSVDDALLKGKPFIYVLDSMDSLSSKADEAKFKKDKSKHSSGKDPGGSYGDGKAKKNSESLRRLVRMLRRTGSVLVIISQTRDNLNAGMFGDKKTRAGGRALKFYAHGEVWLQVGKAIKKDVRGKARSIGHRVVAKIKKNRFTGELHTVETAILPDHGIDDVGSCVDYLIEEKHWKKSKGIIDAGALGKMRRDDLVMTIERDGREDDLRREVGRCWRAIKAEMSTGRKRRYQ